MKHLLLVCLLVLARTAASGEPYSEQVLQWPEVRLQLSREVTATDMFKAGLRPYLRPNAENRNLYAKHAHITVIDREGRRYPSYTHRHFADLYRETLVNHIHGNMDTSSDHQ